MRLLLARALTEALAPAPLAAAALLLVAVRSASSPAAGLGWGALAALLAVGIPYGVVLAGVRARRWSDHHLRVRRQRFAPLALGTATSAAGWVLLRVLGAPGELLALLAASGTGLAVCLAATLVWKMSVHAGVAAGSAVVVALTLGPSTLGWTVPLVAAAAWSRVALRDHTTAQVVVGALVGAAVAGGVFGALR
ncbi:phosphoesterase PA-phosphatase [Kineococcus arenarius]|uniref:phosphoesterase PA-phosphatase n=1 Tax=unclassified Kineococcus TaxID=2621656 RepID=UPI003D7EFBD6